MKSIYSKLFALITIFLSVTNHAYAETVVGRWCDQMIPNNSKYNRLMEIVITDNGEDWLNSNFVVGSSGKNRLRELSGGFYKKKDGNDKYRVVPNDGSLQLLDNDGLIRVASRLENNPKKNECI